MRWNRGSRKVARNRNRERLLSARREEERRQSGGIGMSVVCLENRTPGRRNRFPLEKPGKLFTPGVATRRRNGVAGGRCRLGRLMNNARRYDDRQLPMHKREITPPRHLPGHEILTGPPLSRQPPAAVGPPADPAVCSNASIENIGNIIHLIRVSFSGCSSVVVSVATTDFSFAGWMQILPGRS